MIRRELLQSLRIGRVSRFGLFGCREHHFFKEHLAKLFWRAYIEFLARIGVYALLEVVCHLLEHATVFSHTLYVDTEAAKLHLRKHTRERKLDVAKQRATADLVYLLFEHRAQIVDRHLLGVVLAKRCAEIRERELREREIALSRVYHVGGEHRIEHFPWRVYTRAAEEFIHSLCVVHSDVDFFKKRCKTADALADISLFSVVDGHRTVVLYRNRNLLAAESVGELADVARERLCRLGARHRHSLARTLCRALKSEFLYECQKIKLDKELVKLALLHSTVCAILKRDA